MVWSHITRNARLILVTVCWWLNMADLDLSDCLNLSQNGSAVSDANSRLRFPWLPECSLKWKKNIHWSVLVRFLILFCDLVCNCYPLPLLLAYVLRDCGDSFFVLPLAGRCARSSLTDITFYPTYFKISPSLEPYILNLALEAMSFFFFVWMLIFFF